MCYWHLTSDLSYTPHSVANVSTVSKGSKLFPFRSLKDNTYIHEAHFSFGMKDKSDHLMNNNLLDEQYVSQELSLIFKKSHNTEEYQVMKRKFKITKSMG